MSDKTYNGWPNYETWRVHLEMFDGGDYSEMLDGMERYDAGQCLKEHAENYIEETTSEGLARDWALAFMQAADWYEIADHLMPNASDTAQCEQYEADEAHINAPSGDEAPVKFITMYTTKED